jgi:hypothetical protein
MITWCGVSHSHCHSKVKIVFLEKGAPFAEGLQHAHSTEMSVLNATPPGKITYFQVDG